MRSIKELLELMCEQEELFKRCCFNYGLCLLTAIMGENGLITSSEKNAIENYVYDCFLGEDIDSPEKTRYHPYFWPKGKWQPRLEWMQNEIKKLSENH